MINSNREKKREIKRTREEKRNGRDFVVLMLTMANVKVYSDSFSHMWSRGLSFELY